MFEDFRKQTEDASFPDDKQDDQPPHAPKSRDMELLFGMTPVQRFIIIFMIFIMTIILGLLFLLATSKIVPPGIG